MLHIERKSTDQVVSQEDSANTKIGGRVRIGHIYRLRRGRLGHVYPLRWRYGSEGEVKA
jgi:hypothetical protein